MSIFQTIGFIWFVLTSSLATVAIFFLAYVGLKSLIAKKTESDLPIEVKEMFKVVK